MVYKIEEIHDEICKFVAEKPGQNINQVVKHVYKGKNMCAKQTAENRVRELIGNRLIDERRGSPKGFHSLHVNDNDKFNYLSKQVDKFYEVVNRINGLIEDSSSRLKSLPRPVLDEQFPSIVRTVQHVIFFFVTHLALEIDSVKPIENRELLYLRLVKILTASSKVNVITIHALEKDTEVFGYKLQRVKIRAKDLSAHKWSQDLFKVLLEEAKNLVKLIPIKSHSVPLSSP